MGRVNGNIQGIKDTLLERIELLYDMRQGQDESSPGKWWRS